MKTLKYFDRTIKEDKEAQVYWDGAIFDTGSEELYGQNRSAYQNLALISAVLSSNIYGYKEKYLHKTLAELGVRVDNDKDVKIFSDDVIRRGPLPLFAFAHTKLKIEGKERPLVFIIVRGSSSKPELFANVAGSFTPGSRHPREHIAHSAAKKLIMRELTKYLDSAGGFPARDTRFLLTGHSYGGAASNLIAKQLEDKFAKSNIYCFTFGSPDTIITANFGEGEGSLDYISKTDNNIHNIRNNLDPICLISDLVPLDSEAYTIYGRQHWFSADARWFESLPVAQLATTWHHHEISNYIKYVLSIPDAGAGLAPPARYKELYALGTSILPAGISKLKEIIGKKDK